MALAARLLLQACSRGVGVGGQWTPHSRASVYRWVTPGDSCPLCRAQGHSVPESQPLPRLCAPGSEWQGLGQPRQVLKGPVGKLAVPSHSSSAGVRLEFRVR